jgi:hypothetical protein
MRASDTDVRFEGRLDRMPDGGVAQYMAAAPPDYRSSFSGSALPYANAQQAFYNTPNRGEVRINADGSFVVNLTMPNSYYTDGGTVKVPPALHLMYVVNGQTQQAQMQVSNGVPFRGLTYPSKRHGPLFYDHESPLIRSQEAILRAGGYPEVNIEPDSFWGGRPAR